MQSDTLFLLVERNPERAALFAQALPPGCRLQRIESATVAAARLAGGGVAGVLLDISASSTVVPVLRAADRYIPVFMLAETGSAAPPQLAQYPELQVIATTGNWALALNSAIQRQQHKTNARRAKVITFTGAKGGCGTTTVALSVAHQLASQKEVVLAEVEPGCGGLRQFLNPPKSSSGTSLWQSRSSPNLRIAFESGRNASLDSLTSQADYLLLDLSSSTALNYSVDVALIVTERERISCAAAVTTIERLNEEASARQLGVVLVNKFPYSMPLAISDIERQLGLDILTVIPPSADLCAAASKQNQPLTAYDPDSTVARALASLAQALSSTHESREY